MFTYIKTIISVAYIIVNIINYADRKTFKREMDKNKGVAIFKVSIWSASLGENVVVSYHSWDGKGDLYDLL